MYIYTHTHSSVFVFVCGCFGKCGSFDLRYGHCVSHTEGFSLYPLLLGSRVNEICLGGITHCDMFVITGSESFLATEYYYLCIFMGMFSVIIFVLNLVFMQLHAAVCKFTAIRSQQFWNLLR